MKESDEGNKKTGLMANLTRCWCDRVGRAREFDCLPSVSARWAVSVRPQLVILFIILFPSVSYHIPFFSCAHASLLVIHAS